MKSDDHSQDVELADGYTVKMKYPSLNQFIETNFETSDGSETVVEKTFKVVANCMDTIFTGEDAWDAKDYTPSERMDFVEQLNSSQYKKVENFFSTMPKLSHTIEVVNPKTKEKGSVVLEGLANFFV